MEEKKLADEAPQPPEEKKEDSPPELKKEDAPPQDAKKSEEAPAPTPAPPREIVLKVFMHCEGCARKVRRCLRGFDGVEDVTADCRTSKVVVKGERADPARVLERVQRKSHRKVELISPIPEPPSPDKPPEAEPPKSDDKKEEAPVVITVVLRVYMHCDACAQEIKRRIQRMKGVESAEPDLKGSQVTVKGVVDPQKLVDYVYKRTGKHAVILKVEPEKEEPKPEETKEAKEEKKADEGEKETKKPEEVAKEDTAGGGESKEAAAKPEAEAGGEESKVEVRKNELYYYHPQNYQMYPPVFVQEMNAYPPQMFSDENPNACSLM